MLLLLILLYFFLKQQGKLEMAGRMFLALWASNFALLALELSIDVMGIHIPRASFAPLLSFLTAIFYVLNAAPGVFYFLYIQHMMGKRVSKRFLLLVLLPASLHTMLALVSPWTGWLFAVDALSQYSRGPYFFLTVITNYSYLFFGPLYLLMHHEQLQRKTYSTLLIFPFPVAIAGFLQIMFYGLEVLWISLSLSLLILFFNVESNQVNRDYLTGLFNRRYFQRMATLAVAKKRAGKAQWAFLLDINGFKAINDTYGHAKGDEALIGIARLLEQVAPKHTVVSRYGGDEFALLTPGLSEHEVAQFFDDLEQKLAATNAAGQFCGSIRVSVGCACLPEREHTDLDVFLVQLDKSMYVAKRESKKATDHLHSVLFHMCTKDRS
nr:GGDEF domain-containing protein [uncultured Sphaerochaeta sp.]